MMTFSDHDAVLATRARQIARAEREAQIQMNLASDSGSGVAARAGSLYQRMRDRVAMVRVEVHRTRRATALNEGAG